MNIDDCKLIKFKEFADPHGNLVAIEGIKDVPFNIKRLFYIYDTLSDVIRGKHANRKSEFILICLSGSCKVDLFDGINTKTIKLECNTEGLYISKMVWKDMYAFSRDCVLLCLSNEYYDADEYIRNKEEYIKEVS